MSAQTEFAHPPAPAADRSGRLVAWLLFSWTVLATVAVWWLTKEAATSGDSIIRIGAGEAKSWAAWLHENIALARLNFPWALAWLFFLPYVLWIGVRFSFEGRRWRTRLPVLVAAGVAFIWSAQWLSRHIGGGEATIIMVKYTADTSVGRVGSPDAPDGATDRLVTNHYTQIVLAGDTVRATNHAAWEMATSELLSRMPTNLPHVLARSMAGSLPPSGPVGPRRWSAALDALAYIALIGLAHAGVFHRRYREREQQATLLASRLNEARLHALQAQLQPHFLFNTLNGIATLLRRDPATAEEMLLSLSDLLRISLGSSHRQEIPLREEMDFLARYLAIQKMRFGERLHVVEAVEPAALDCLVPALLLQPLVENAIRHGLEPAGRPGQLRIAATREGHWLRLTVEDNGVGLSAGNSPGADSATTRRGSHPSVEGVGLANVRERLATLHHGAHEFEIAARPEGGVVVNLKLPARAEQVAANETAPQPIPPNEPRCGSGSAGHRKPPVAEVSGARPSHRQSSEIQKSPDTIPLPAGPGDEGRRPGEYSPKALSRYEPRNLSRRGNEADDMEVQRDPPPHVGGYEREVAGEEKRPPERSA